MRSLRVESHLWTGRTGALAEPWLLRARNLRSLLKGEVWADRIAWGPNARYTAADSYVGRYQRLFVQGMTHPPGQARQQPRRARNESPYTRSVTAIRNTPAGQERTMYPFV